MKKFILTILALFPVFLKAQTLSVQEYEAKLKTAYRAQLIDIRSMEEFNRGHLRNALNVDYNTEEFETLMEQSFKKDFPVFIYDFSGGKGALAADYLRKLGFKTVYDLRGGFASWTSASKPYVSAHKTTEPIAAMPMDGFDRVLRDNAVVFVDFYADWCKPCKKMNPILTRIANERAKTMKMLKVDVDKNDAMTNIFRIEAVPTYILFKNGKQVWRGEGEIPEGELRSILKANKVL